MDRGVSISARVPSQVHGPRGSWVPSLPLIPGPMGAIAWAVDIGSKTRRPTLLLAVNGRPPERGPCTFHLFHNGSPIEARESPRSVFDGRPAAPAEEAEPGNAPLTPPTLWALAARALLRPLACSSLTLNSSNEPQRVRDERLPEQEVLPGRVKTCWWARGTAGAERTPSRRARLSERAKCRPHHRAAVMCRS